MWLKTRERHLINVDHIERLIPGEPQGVRAVMVTSREHVLADDWPTIQRKLGIEPATPKAG